MIASSRRAVDDDDKESDFIPMSLEKPSGLNMEDFLPVRTVCWTFAVYLMWLLFLVKFFLNIHDYILYMIILNQT